MYTSEENKELVETIKKPIRYYRISLYGYGGEASYMKLTKDQYEFWNNHVEEYGDSDAVNYCVCAEDGDFDFEDLEDLPEEMQFLKVPGEDYSSSWYESPVEIVHQYGVDYNNARISIEEVEDDDYASAHIADVVDGEDLADYIDEIQAEDDYETELVEMDCCDEEQSDYMLQFWSAEKGGFFDGIIASKGPFDPKKLKIYTTEYFNGDDTVESISYDGEDVDNQGGDTNGKGYSVHLWKNV